MRATPSGIAVAVSLLPVLPAQANWVLRAGPVAPPARSGHALVPGPGNTILLFGGYSSSQFFSDTWVLGATGWRQVTPAVAPPGRMSPGMAFDVLRARVVLFGGMSLSAPAPFNLDDTWEWDGSTWLLRSTSTRPAPRKQCAMHYDLLRGTTVLFGGFSAPSFLGDTWEWDGIAWTRRNTPTPPTPRCASAMVFDLANPRMLLFGGNAVGGLVGDTWEYDGVSWQQRNPAHSPPPRFGHAMAFDWQRNRVVMFGGIALPVTGNGDTWEWDGADWTRRSPAVSPPGRSNASQALDLARNRIVLFGGSALAGTDLADTWEYFTTAVPSVTTLAPGCAGSAGTPALGTAQPWLGDVLPFAVDHTPPGAPALLALGLSSTTWGTLSLPASLAAFGMPGCALAVSVDATIPMTGAVPACTLTLPPNNAFAGMSLFVQALVVDPAANPAGCVLSSALALRLGAR